jgi:hypothetical protein
MDADRSRHHVSVKLKTPHVRRRRQRIRWVLKARRRGMPWAGIQQMLISAGGIGATLVTHTTAGAFTETVIVGAQSCVVEVWGPSNAGGNGTGTACTASSGGGAGAGGYCRTSLAVTPGLTFNYFVGASGGANSTVSSGTQAITTMTANGGAVGANGPAGAGGAGGTASGGTAANTAGGNGQNGTASPASGGGGIAIAGINANLGSNGGKGGNGVVNTGRTAGGNGGVAFFYT